MKEKNLIDLIPLDEDTQNIAKNIIEEKNIDKVQNLVHLFNLNQQKKNVVRILKLNSLLDTVADSMLERFEKRPGEFSNNDLLNYMNIIQNSLDKENKNLNLVDNTPAIQLNQVNVNIGEKLDRESRQKVDEAVKAILAKINQDKSNTTPEIIVEEQLNETKIVEDEEININDLETIIENKLKDED